MVFVYPKSDMVKLHNAIEYEKLILRKVYKIFNQKKKKKLLIMQETYMYCNIRYGTHLNTIVRLQSLKPMVGTLKKYLLDGDTFIIRIQCSVLEVL